MGFRDVKGVVWGGIVEIILRLVFILVYGVVI